MPSWFRSLGTRALEASEREYLLGEWTPAKIATGLQDREVRIDVTCAGQFVPVDVSEVQRPAAMTASAIA
ncbi:hypothetical protein ABZX92_19035 [Lentzea sp. NPDC006480]|uniref:hypothetical protein n=1 Tax=Lentzea sp. NPDC006480 TaxID=3157176 RepID=UPI0033BBAE82